MRALKKWKALSLNFRRTKIEEEQSQMLPDLGINSRDSEIKCIMCDFRCAPGARCSLYGTSSTLKERLRMVSIWTNAAGIRPLVWHLFHWAPIALLISF
eukprot:IDg20446t1